MKALFYSAIAILTLSCSSTHIMTTKKNDGDLFTKSFNEAAAGRRAKIVLKSGRRIDVSDARLNAKSITWIDALSTRSQTPIEDVSAVIIVNRGKGVARGLKYGALGGALYGGFTSYFGNHPYENKPPSRSEKIVEAVVYSFLYSIVGSVSGLAVGGVVGYTDTFKFD